MRRTLKDQWKSRFVDFRQTNTDARIDGLRNVSQQEPRILPGASIQTVGTNNYSGSYLQGYAAADHVHCGYFLASSLGNLPTPTGPMIGIVDDNATCTYYKWDTVEEEWVEMFWGIQVYESFPSIPTTPTYISCKGQNWYAESGYTVWIPQSLFTSETGAPGT